MDWVVVCIKLNTFANNLFRKLPFVLIVIVISIVPLIIFKTMESLKLNGNEYYEIDLYYGSKTLVLNFIVLVMIIILLRNHHINKSLFTINLFFSVFLVWIFISALLAEYKMTAFFGWPFRWQGAFTYFMYYVIFVFTFIYIKPKDIKYILFFLFLSAIPITIYAILQYYHIEPLTGVFVDYFRGDLIDGKIRSTIGNRNFLGSYECLVSLTAISMYLNSKSKKQSIVLFGLSILFFSGVVVSLTRSVWIGFFFALLFLLILSKKNFHLFLKRFIILLISFILLILLLNKTGNESPSDRLESTKVQIEKARDGDSEQLGTSRMHIYVRSIKVFFEHPFFGTGPDCLGYYTPVTPDESKIYWPSDNVICIDKAHSEYLEYLVTMGFPGLILYFLFIISIVFPSIKNRRKLSTESLGILTGIIGYLIQASFNIGVISVLPIFIVYLALLAKCTKNATSCYCVNKEIF